MKNQLASSLKQRREALSYRKRCTLRALFSMGSAPFIFSQAKSLFDGLYISAGGSKALMGWIGLASIYYLTVRAIVDLFTDWMDWRNGRYGLVGGDVSEVCSSRTNSPPYDTLSAPKIKRDWTPWQYALAMWWLVEFIIVCCGVLAVLSTIDSLKLYVDFCASSKSALSLISCSFGELVYGSSYFLIYFSISSMGRRNEAGVMPLPLRWLGLPNFHPGQNVSPRWLNEVMIKLTGRPM